VEIKYTKEGKKVAVLGKLNNETWIVQEIFISNGQELPCGENFTTKTLLDEPAVTWQANHVINLEERKSRLEQGIKTLEGEAKVLKRKVDSAKLINRATEKYQDLDVSQLDTLFAFLSGKITHIVLEHYWDYKIVSLIDALESTDNYRYPTFEGLKLVSLFGCNESGERRKKDRSFRLDWRINEYRDGSGSSWHIAYPCTSHKEAVSLLDNLVSQKEKASEKLIQLKEKYNLIHPTQKKIKEYKAECIKNKKASVKQAEDKLEKEKLELQTLKENNYGSQG